MLDLVISLGHRCYTAQHQRRMMIHSGTMPFDWVWSRNEGPSPPSRPGSRECSSPTAWSSATGGSSIGISISVTSTIIRCIRIS
ncbi:MAG: hypothetical protein HXX10_24800 [Rhodoplanes sp.]|nr:hypothetical protein [Rhodoplanes sp.]